MELPNVNDYWIFKEKNHVVVDSVYPCCCRPCKPPCTRYTFVYWCEWTLPTADIILFVILVPYVSSILSSCVSVVVEYVCSPVNTLALSRSQHNSYELLFLLLLGLVLIDVNYYFNASTLYVCACICVCTARVCSRNFHTREPISHLKYKKRLYSHSHTSERRARVDKVPIIIFILWFNFNKNIRLCVEEKRKNSAAFPTIVIIRYFGRNNDIKKKTKKKMQSRQFAREFYWI